MRNRMKFIAVILVFFSLPILAQQQMTPENREFPYQLGTSMLKMSKNYIQLDKVFVNELKNDTIKVLNVGTEDLKLSFARIPDHLKVKAVPETLKPNEKGAIVITYNAALQKNGKGTQQWGQANSNFAITLNDQIDDSNRNIIHINANISEDYSKYTKKQLMDAPVIVFDSVKYDFGKVKQGEVVKYDFKFKNTGKTDLEIRDVKAG